MTAHTASPPPLVSLGDLTWDVLAKPDTLLLPGGDSTGRIELSGGGSAANLAVWAQRAGYPARFVGKIGRDRFGELATAELRAEGVDAHLTLSAQHPTGVILGLIDRRGQRAMLTGQGADWELLPEEVPTSALAGAAHLHLTAWSLFRDPPQAAALHAAALARAGGATLSLDPGSFQMIQGMGRDNFLQVLSGVPFDILFPNDDEARAMSGCLDREDAMTWFRTQFPHALIVMKLDDEGVLIEGPEQPRVQVPATEDRAIDATGAGDAFGGAFLAGWLAHRDAVKAAQLAVQVGGWVVARFGARPPADDDLRARLRGGRA
ncbi:carbohydrate kinase family protein [Deinococcus multiflagellatus]|uniref:carbohydrate kinase family protein n=1 Tax=Deinococcus multiflagellatus TaxID=1656887 RepID=UPI001CD02352|nr:carbohydrate kinase family protein [Deinococcus multiflagellatus]MBZ9712588.1 carbohydrate kinase family protein [Deinococcus multiflagellatus]